jgi:hypothetical protein
MRGPPPPLTGVVLALALVFGSVAAGAQTGGDSGGTIPLPDRADGAPIERVDVVLAGSSGNAAREGAAVARLRDTLSALEGRPYSRLLVEGRLNAARQRLGQGRITHLLRDGASPGRVRLEIVLDLSQGTPDVPAAVQAPAFPVLHQDGRSLVTAIVTGGFGFYSDPNPWFGQAAQFTRGSPIAGRRPGAQPGWTEGFVEAGLGFATQIGDSPFYAFGAMTVSTSWSLGQDIYRDDSRIHTAIERGYGGLLYVDPSTGGALNISVGRQNVTLNDGFLIHFVRGSANIGERGGLYLGPRNANDFSVLVEGRQGPWSLKAFYIDPNELETLESRTTFAGINIGYAITPDLRVDASVILIPRSNSTFVVPSGGRLAREGLTTIAGHIRWNRAFGVAGLWLESEIAHQSHDRFDMSAFAGYGLIGYQASRLPWTPSLSYRYAYHSGDDPQTERYERFDPLLSTGLGNWLQGVTFGKVTTNSNLAVHRLQFNVTPDPRLNVTFDWHLLRAPERNNLGGNPLLSQLSSQDLGQEFTLTGRWAIDRNWYLQAIASVAVPGRALRDLGADRPWTTLQASFYWSF